ncbi:putative RNA-directed DNA polymerase from transposon BS [Amphibalanus amphitrite]|uniref:Putative RNA-directed DNA polymerase from transposon BS n=1 Tax=Amphibalanus amphitrite TaxID=1232801 RepID=A0A6A4WFQ9_AMPAM|nr:putative RNA-directed DNA polymerase from transposon BS [Amphibalanus amphitrite]
MSVGFREGRSVEDSLGRLVQQVQDGWQRPRSRKKQPADGETAQRYVLTAFDFSRAYDTVDHRLLRVRLLQQGIPLCLITWIWSFLRDRRAHTEVNGTKSRERIFRAGLPQGTVLAPTLFLLWAAPLADALKKIPGTTPYMYADDTATLCSGNTILNSNFERWPMDMSGAPKNMLLRPGCLPRPTPASHVEILEREVRAAARVITGCPVSTRTHALLAEAGMPPVSARRLSLAARFLAKARALPREDPLRTVADEVVPARLSSVTGWRQCSDRGCRAGWCRACGEEADTPDHVLLRCPALMNARLRIFGTIFPSLSDVRRDDAVAALARVARYLQSR